MKDKEPINVCPECYAVQRGQGTHCPACGADRHRRETLDRLTMLVLVMVCFGMAWSLFGP